MASDYEKQEAAARFCAAIARERDILERVTILGRDLGDVAGRGEYLDYSTGEQAVELVDKLIEARAEHLAAREIYGRAFPGAPVDVP